MSESLKYIYYLPMDKGRLFVVATPIGNLADITGRAVETLKSVDIVAAEDTRHSRKLLTSLGIASRLVSLHDHNERTRSDTVITDLANGKDVALISDAGTPLISDPGFHLVRKALQNGIRVVPVPGASAVIAALSVAGLPANRFYFHGFLAEKSSARRVQLQQLADFPQTLVFYESGKRIMGCLEDIASCLGSDREAVICRELTKLYETIDRGTVLTLLDELRSGAMQQRGEFVILIAGAKQVNTEIDEQLTRRLLKEIGDSLPTGQSASIISRALGYPRKVVYRLALELKEGS